MKSRIASIYFSCLFILQFSVVVLSETYDGYNKITGLFFVDNDIGKLDNSLKASIECKTNSKCIGFDNIGNYKYKFGSSMQTNNARNFYIHEPTIGMDYHRMYFISNAVTGSSITLQNEAQAKFLEYRKNHCPEPTAKQYIYPFNNKCEENYCFHLCSLYSQECAIANLYIEKAKLFSFCSLETSKNGNFISYSPEPIYDIVTLLPAGPGGCSLESYVDYFNCVNTNYNIIPETDFSGNNIGNDDHPGQSCSSDKKNTCIGFNSNGDTKNDFGDLIASTEDFYVHKVKPYMDFVSITGYDFGGLDYKGVADLTESKCAKECSLTPECVGASYNFKSSFCYYYSKFGKPIPNSGFKLLIPAGPSGCPLSTIKGNSKNKCIKIVPYNKIPNFYFYDVVNSVTQNLFEDCTTNQKCFGIVLNRDSNFGDLFRGLRNPLRNKALDTYVHQIVNGSNSLVSIKGWNSPNGDLKSVVLKNTYQCANLCVNTIGCVGAVWRNAKRTCYIKQFFNTPQGNNTTDYELLLPTGMRGCPDGFNAQNKTCFTICIFPKFGDDCEFECAKKLPVQHQLLLPYLFLSEPKFQEFSRIKVNVERKAYTTFQIAENDKAATLYLKNFLQVDVDFNGNQIIEHQEIIDTLKYRSVIIDDDVQNWKINSIYTTEAKMDVVFSSALNCFLNSTNHRFDCLDDDNLNIKVASRLFLTNKDCKLYDPYWKPLTHERPQVMTTYNNSSKIIDQVCVYSNGLLLNTVEIQTTDFAIGKDKNFQDFSDTALSFRRIYCIYTEYNNPAEYSFDCAAGLRHDGTPIDLTPELTLDGIVFSYRDTSAGESEFDIYVGEPNSEFSKKEFSVGIPYSSKGCDKISRHISFTDKVNMNKVGEIKEYTIQAIQSYYNLDEDPNGLSLIEDEPTQTFTRPFRIPFYVKIKGTVVTKSRVGVAGVTVRLCHINSTTAVEDTNPSFCPLISFTTDKLGQYVGEIRVSSPTWNRTVENFKISAFLKERLKSGIEVNHTFSYMEEIVSLTHLTDSVITPITDNSTISIFGTVAYDTKYTNGYTCAFSNVPIQMVDGSGNVANTNSDSDGNFNFSVTRGDEVVIAVPLDFQYQSWRYTLTTKNIVATTPDYIFADVTGNRLLEFTSDQDWIKVMNNYDSKLNYSPSMVNNVFQQFGTGAVKYIINGIENYSDFVFATSKTDFDLYHFILNQTIWNTQNNFEVWIEVFSTSQSLAASMLSSGSIKSPSSIKVEGTKDHTWFFEKVNVPANNKLRIDIVVQINSGTDNMTISIADLVMFISPGPTWRRYIFEVPSSSDSYTSNLLVQAPEGSLVEIDDIHAYLIPIFTNEQKFSNLIPFENMDITSQKQAHNMQTEHSDTRLLLKDFSEHLFKKPKNVKNEALNNDPSKSPISFHPTTDNLCSSSIDLSNGLNSREISGNSNCNFITFPKTEIQISICGYTYNSFDPITSIKTSRRLQFGRPRSKPTVSPMQPTLVPLGLSVEPTFVPYAKPTVTPTVKPTFNPSLTPSSVPSVQPSIVPIGKPTDTPTFLPSKPTGTPTATPTFNPSLKPSFIPSVQPTCVPSAKPIFVPSVKPTPIPTALPSIKPTFVPSVKPTIIPSVKPSVKPTFVPSKPTVKPTFVPSVKPTLTPTFIIPVGLWQVSYFNTLYSGGIGLESCQFHDICHGHMMQIDISNITNFVKSDIITYGNPVFSMTSTVIPNFDLNEKYSIYGSNVAGTRGSDLLFSSSVLNKLQPLPGVLQSYRYLSIVTGPSDPSGILLQKLTIKTSCPPTVSPTKKPTFAPTFTPSTIKPSSPTYNPTFKPTSTYTPTISPTVKPSAPTYAPSTAQFKNYENNTANAVIVISNRFDESTLSSAVPVISSDSFVSSKTSSIQITAATAPVKVIRIRNTIYTNVALKSKIAVFKYIPGDATIPSLQFLNLMGTEISAADDFTVMLWIKFQANNDFNNSVLFSVGDIKFPSDATDPSINQLETIRNTNTNKDMHIAVVYHNVAAGYRKVYINGVYYATLDKIITTKYTNLNPVYIGRSLGVDSAGLNAELKVFDFYYGEVSPQDISIAYIIGPVEGTIKVPSSMTEYDVSVAFYSISLIPVNIHFYGGSSGPDTTNNTKLSNVTTSFEYKMFGSESSFQLLPVDEQCLYRPIYSVDPETSSTNIEMVPAMNYTITLKDTARSAPEFGPDICPTPNSVCQCGESLLPIVYMKNGNLVNQSFVVNNVNDTVSDFKFYYRSSLCLELVSFTDKQFSNKDGEKSPEGFSCFDNLDVLYLDKSKNKGPNSTKTVLKLFENYPEGINWFNGKDAIIFNEQPLVNWYIEDGTLQILDQASGGNSFIKYDYNTNLIPRSAKSRVAKPIGNTYVINSTNILPVFPYTLKFQLYARRQSSASSTGFFNTGDKIFTAYIPVLGVLAKEVPNYYPVSSDPNLIFLIIRDPPGGTSYTKISEGSSINFGISIDNMYAFDNSLLTEREADLGAHIENSVNLFGAVFKITDLELLTGMRSSTALTISSAFGSESTHDYSFQFQSDFSTSDDPNIAGHPSDVIIGGGVDIVVLEATKVDTKEDDPNKLCFYSYPVLQWYPGKVTTFILPVIEIEQIIEDVTKLAEKAEKANEFDNMNKTLHLRDNWATILTNYRKQTNGLTAPLSKEMNQYNTVVNSFHDFIKLQRDQALSASVLQAAATTFLTILSVAQLITTPISALNPIFWAEVGVNIVQAVIFTTVEATINQYCGIFGVASFVSYTKYARNICSDFVPSRWADFKNFFTDACSVAVGFDTESNQMTTDKLDGNAAAFYGNLCIKGKPIDPTRYPKDPNNQNSKSIEVPDVDQTLFQFLQSNKTYLTFGAKSPTTLTWTTTVSNSLTHTTSFETDYSLDYGITGTSNTKIVGIAVESKHYAGLSGTHKINVGQASTSTEENTRTVEVSLGDDDIGDFFVVRITEDPVHGTPVFTTMGGKSKCPGETATSRRESNVKITEIRHKCGPNSNSICDETALKSGDTAMFSVIIFNDSPTDEPVSYTLNVAKTFDYDGGKCGDVGRQSGLDISFSQTDIVDIPYRELIEVPFYVAVSSGSTCSKFQGIELFLGCACESADTYQYGVIFDDKTGDVTPNYGKLYGMSNSTAKFSVAWATSVAGAAKLGLLDSAQVTSSSYDLRPLGVAIIVLLSLLLLIGIFILLKLYQKDDIKNTMKKYDIHNKNQEQLHDMYPNDSDDFIQTNETYKSPTSIFSSPIYARSSSKKIKTPIDISPLDHDLVTKTLFVTTENSLFTAQPVTSSDEEHCR